MLDHFGYKAPSLDVWNHLTWYSEDRTLQWLQALRAEMNPHHIRGHEFCHREEDHSTLAITRAVMDEVGATIATQTAATSTASSAPGISTTLTPSELAASGQSISPSYEFVTSDNEDNSRGIPQIYSEDEVSSNHPPVPKITLKKKKKAKKGKGEGEDESAAKVPKIKKRKKTDATKSSNKAEKLILKVPLRQPFSQKLQTLATKQSEPKLQTPAAKQSEQSTISETPRKADDSGSDKDDDESTRPSSSQDKMA